MPPTDGRVRNRPRGVAVGLLTSFDDDLEIQHDKLGANAKSFSGDGTSSFLAAANVSEYHSLSQQGRVNVMEMAADTPPDSVCALAGVGGSTKAVTDLMEIYDHVGVDAMMVVPPNHTYVHEWGLVRYHEKLDTVTDTPLAPYIRGFDPPVSSPHDLSRIEGVVDVKHVIEDPAKLGSTVAAADDDVVWMGGSAEPYAVPLRSEGVEGSSVGVSNFRPEIGLALLEAFTEESWERAREIRGLTLPSQALRDETGTDNDPPGAISVPIVKKGLELTGLHGGEAREPIQSLSVDDERRTEELYGELDDGTARVID